MPQDGMCCDGCLRLQAGSSQAGGLCLRPSFRPDPGHGRNIEMAMPFINGMPVPSPASVLLEADLVGGAVEVRNINQDHSIEPGESAKSIAGRKKNSKLTALSLVPILHSMTRR